MTRKAGEHGDEEPEGALATHKWRHRPTYLDIVIERHVKLLWLDTRLGSVPLEPASLCLLRKLAVRDLFSCQQSAWGKAKLSHASMIYILILTNLSSGLTGLIRGFSTNEVLVGGSTAGA